MAQQNDWQINHAYHRLKYHACVLAKRKSRLLRLPQSSLVAMAQSRWNHCLKISTIEQLRGLFVPMYRSKRLLKAAQGQSCMVRIPYICNGDNDTTVAAHSNQLIHGKGTSLKAHDCYIAWACSACHAAIDQGNMSKEDKLYYWQQGFERTLLAMFLLGVVVVA